MEMNNWRKTLGDKNGVSTRNLSYVCADSTSVTFKEFVDYTADKIGVKHPGGVPMFLAKGVLGGDLVKLLTTPMKISNQKISEVYKFVYPSYKEGINSILDS
jgi:NAD dependent epimerase/dehydratase family enzyme